MPIIIGITGLSGSGKSTISKLFETYGYITIDFDEIVHKLYQNDIDCLEEIKNNFDGVIDNNNVINRKNLAKIVFNDKEKLDILNKIMNKHIMKEFNKILYENKDKNIILDAPLLFESNLNDFCDYTLCVICEYEEKLKRIINRDKIDIEMAKRRLANQKTDEYYQQICDFAIENNGENLNEKVQSILKTIEDGENKNNVKI